jgi:hypothetical protein
VPLVKQKPKQKRWPTLGNHHQVAGRAMVQVLFEVTSKDSFGRPKAIEVHYDEEKVSEPRNNTEFWVGLAPEAMVRLKTKGDA